MLHCTCKHTEYPSHSRAAMVMHREDFVPPTPAKQMRSLSSSPCSSSSWRQASSWKPSQTSSSWRLPDQLSQVPVEQIGLVCHLPCRVHPLNWVQHWLHQVL